jgi:hypothetical protein
MEAHEYTQQLTTKQQNTSFPEFADEENAMMARSFTRSHRHTNIHTTMMLDMLRRLLIHHLIDWIKAHISATRIHEFVAETCASTQSIRLGMSSVIVVSVAVDTNRQSRQSSILIDITVSIYINSYRLFIFFIQIISYFVSTINAYRSYS